MPRVYLGLGSNLQQPERQLDLAVLALAALPKTKLRRLSKTFHSRPFGLAHQANFVNRVIELNTLLSPLVLLNYCQQIEKQQGRIRRKKNGPRTLDIDILLYGQLVLQLPRLQLPHPRIAERDFVYLPLLEVNPHLLDAGLGIEKNAPRYVHAVSKSNTRVFRP